MKCFNSSFLKKAFIVIAVFANAFWCSGQGKPALTEDSYKKWKYITDEAISPDGNWVTFEQKDRDSLRLLFLYGTGVADTICNAQNGTFSTDSKFFMYSKVLKNEKAKPQITHYLKNLETKEVLQFNNPRSCSFVNNGGSLVQFIRNSSDSSKQGKNLFNLVLFEPISKDSVVFENIQTYRYSSNADYMVFSKKKSGVEGLYLYDIKGGGTRLISTSANIRLLNFSKNLSSFAYITRLKKGKTASYSIHVFNTKNLKLIDSISTSSHFIPKGYEVDSQKVDFSPNGKMVYFKIVKTKDCLLPKAKGATNAPQIWKWDSPTIPPMNKEGIAVVNSHYCAYDLNKKRFTQLSDGEMPFLQFPEGEDLSISIGFSNNKYLKYEGIKAGALYDSYIVNMHTGEKKLVLERKYYNPSISYDKEYIAWFEPQDSSWYSMNTKTFNKTNLTASISDIFYNDELDKPMHATHFGLIGWINSGHDLLINSKYDLWKIDASGKNAPICLTKGLGKSSKTALRLIKTSESQRYYDLNEDYFFTAYQDKTKKAGYSCLLANGEVKSLIFSDHSYPKISFSKDKRFCIWRKQSFTEYPEIYYSDSKFSKTKQLSVTNPQQKQYNWGTSSLVEWESFNKDTLQGLLIKPENFDPNKKYPVLVYFYEKRSDNLHRYTAPAPIGTVINWTYCASNEYIVFIPDVVFRAGEPGNSSYDAVVSGVKWLCEKYSFIDKNRIGLNGHSWGGYQIAYLVTKTNLFKAAVSGAPVANMTSAYGGIRWGSGKSRMFQYESGQSRIGGTLWEKPLNYINNSPLFFLPNVKTPLLIMHNDKDGSVMWEQGIELFMALRRLEKSAWMLNYSGEDHKLSKWDNKIDYTRKVMSYYDYYLKGAPKPEWM